MNPEKSKSMHRQWNLIFRIFNYSLASIGEVHACAVLRRASQQFFIQSGRCWCYKPWKTENYNISTSELPTFWTKIGLHFGATTKKNYLCFSIKSTGILKTEDSKVEEVTQLKYKFYS